MKRTILIAVVALLALPAVAAANTIRNATLTCTSLAFHYSHFATGETVVLAWSTGLQQTVPLAGEGDYTEAPPTTPGALSVTVTWPAGTISLVAQGSCGTAPPVVPPTVPPTVPPVVPPTVPPACTAHLHLFGHASIGPEYYVHNPKAPVTIRASGAGAAWIRVTITGNHHRWTRLHRGSSWTFRVAQGNQKIWGHNRTPAGFTWGPHTVTVTFGNRCASGSINLSYFNHN